ncbi:Protein of unknown function, partial [Gryllus bimaculatus]
RQRQDSASVENAATPHACSLTQPISRDARRADDTPPARRPPADHPPASGGPRTTEDTRRCDRSIFLVFVLPTGGRSPVAV